MRFRREIQCPAGRDDRGVDRRADFNRLYVLLPARQLTDVEDVHIAGGHTDVDLSIHVIGRALDFREQIDVPVFLPRLGVETMDDAHEFRYIDQTVVNRGCTHGDAEYILAAALLRFRHDQAAVVPYQAGVLVHIGFRVEVIIHGRNIAGLGGVDAPEVADTRASANLRDMADPDIDPVLIYDRRGQEVVR